MPGKGVIDPTPGEEHKLHDTAGNIVYANYWVQYTNVNSDIVVGLIAGVDILNDQVTVSYINPEDGTLGQDSGVTPETSVLVLMKDDGTLVGYGS